MIFLLAGMTLFTKCRAVPWTMSPTCTFKKRNYVLKFFVVPNDTQPILGADACTELGAIVRVRAVDKPLMN
jgi:hypothetical protein